MKDLLKYFKGYIRESLLGPLFKLLEASFELLVPILIAGIVDETIPRKDSSHLYWMVFLLMGLAALGVVVAVVAQYYSSKAAVGFTRQMTSDLYQKILRLPKASRDELTTSSLVTRLTSDTYQIQTGINQFLRCFRPHHYGLSYQPSHYLVVLAHGGNFNGYYRPHVSSDESSLCQNSPADRPTGQSDS